MAQTKTRITKRLSLLILLATLGACTALGAYELNNRFGNPTPSGRLMTQPDQAETTFYKTSVEPIFNSRCISCHACYDAPCQLKMSSSAGIDRGISQSPVYSGTRLIAKEPTRLFIDSENTKGWRERGFDPVLNERAPTQSANLAGSLLYQVLKLKKAHPLPTTKVLSEQDFNFSSKRENQCPPIETFELYAAANPKAGMPYGFPGLKKSELAAIKQWLTEGAPLPATALLSKSHQQQVDIWEQYLNQPDNKGRLVSRYLYEHLFLANLYFDVLGEQPAQRTYFKLVRSTSPSGKPINIIATRRPTDAPQTAEFYYRLQRQTAVVVTKTNLPYALSPQRMHWLDKLFFSPDYTVKALPGYGEANFNPFSTYKEIPANSRYRFMLEEGHFFIAGFIKGPVCRGQVAVGVINDQFWVFFVDPDAQAMPMLDGFLEQQIPNLRLPSEEGSNAGILSYWTKYSELHRKYLQAKSNALKTIFKDQPLTMDLFWDGDGNNDNAALTVFRSFDDAAVVKGLIGKPPKTAWVIDYPLLERIHYLLTAGFDVFGNVGHQLNTRLYMDFLRLEGEFNFLAFLPPKTRSKLRDFWYRDASERLTKQLNSYDIESLSTPAITYTTDTPKLELYDHIKQRLQRTANTEYSLSNTAVPSAHRTSLKKLENIRGIAASLLAEMTVVMVEEANGNQKLYTILANRAHLNITSLLNEEENRLPKEDSISVANGILGDYPNAFLQLPESELDTLVNTIKNLETEADYAAMIDQFGVRRTNPNFWQYSDRLHDAFLQQHPKHAGWLDYNRVENR